MEMGEEYSRGFFPVWILSRFAPMMKTSVASRLVLGLNSTEILRMLYVHLHTVVSLYNSDDCAFFFRASPLL